MNITKGKLGILALVGILFLSGCTKVDDKTVNQEDPTTLPVVIAPVEEIPEESPAAGTSEKIDESTARAMEFDKLIEGIKSITLKDVDGNVIERTFSDEEIIAIETAFNESYIMDTMYIAMIAGYNMTIELENGEEVFITSYGDPVFIVARIGDGDTYHLGCETIATILLEGVN
ncbi:MAG: hypothetical protein SCL54_12225 [Bacillota bacterium]|nr:hypothetical protein [Bacillota bacterium]